MARADSTEPVDVSGLLTVAQAIAILDAEPVNPRIERVALSAALGRRLAGDVISDRDYPPFDKCLMDGFAVRNSDVLRAPVELNVVGEIPAGAKATRPLGAGEAMAIMTGAPMPPGADGVVPVEDTQLPLPPPSGEGRGEGVSNWDNPSDPSSPLTPVLSRKERERLVRILRASSPGRFIARRGADCRAGTAVLSRGTLFGPAQLAVAASVGCAQVDVFAKPRVAVLSTGDEIVPVDQTPGDSQIRNSNSILLVSLLTRLGCEVTDLGIARDDPSAIRSAIQAGLNHDALFVSGGMSMGEYDFVPKILLDIGVALKITKLRIKPGKPFVFGTIESPARFVFGLPGNPVSGFVCTLRLASRLIARMSGASVLERWINAPLATALPANGPREFYQPAVWDGSKITPLKWNGSADIHTLAQANALLVRTADAPALSAGQQAGALEMPT
jgi:molybdopterin molybdotransferase